MYKANSHFLSQMATQLTYLHLENTFLNVAMECRKIQMQIGSVDKLIDCVQQLDGAFDAATNPDLVLFMDTFKAEIIRSKMVIENLAKKHPKLRSTHDRIFKNKLGLVGRIPRGITKLFEEFIKGITFFQVQQDHTNVVPIYHRFDSCGVGNTKHRTENLICAGTPGKAEIKRRRTTTNRCYIERLIFDALWKMETINETQDDKHVKRIELTKQDFQTCWGDQRDVCVHVDYMDNFPYKVYIENYYGKRLISSEVYTKTYVFSVGGNKTYEAIVECLRTTGRKSYAKSQSFRYEEDWHALPYVIPLVKRVDGFDDPPNSTRVGGHTKAAP